VSTRFALHKFDIDLGVATLTWYCYESADGLLRVVEVVCIKLFFSYTFFRIFTYRKFYTYIKPIEILKKLSHLYK